GERRASSVSRRRRPLLRLPDYLFGGPGAHRHPRHHRNRFRVRHRATLSLSRALFRSLLFGGTGLDVMYGLSMTSGVADDDNFFVTDRYPGDASLTTAEDLQDRWTGLDSRADRISALTALLAPYARTDLFIDKLYKPNG